MNKKVLRGMIVILLFGLFVGCGEKKLLFNAVIIGNGSIEDLEISEIEYLNEIFLEENMTLGAMYKNENWNPLDEHSDEYLYDETSPPFRTHIVSEENQLNNILCNPPQVDFDNEMILVYMFTEATNRNQIIKNVSLEDVTLKIEFTTERAKTGYRDVTVPKRRFIVIKIDILDVNEVEFIRV